MHFSKSFILAFAALTAAHPGHEAEEFAEALAARSNFVSGKRALDACASKLEARGVFARGMERRKAEMTRQRIARRIDVQGEFTDVQN